MLIKTKVCIICKKTKKQCGIRNPVDQFENKLLKICKALSPKLINDRKSTIVKFHQSVRDLNTKYACRFQIREFKCGKTELFKTHANKLCFASSCSYKHKKQMCKQNKDK